MHFQFAQRMEFARRWLSMVVCVWKEDLQINQLGWNGDFTQPQYPDLELKTCLCLPKYISVLPCSSSSGSALPLAVVEYHACQCIPLAWTVSLHLPTFISNLSTPSVIYVTLRTRLLSTLSCKGSKVMHHVLGESLRTRTGGGDEGSQFSGFTYDYITRLHGVLHTGIWTWLLGATIYTHMQYCIAGYLRSHVQCDMWSPWYREGKGGGGGRRREGRFEGWGVWPQVTVEAGGVV